jgi:hypothetical protein
LICGSQQGVSEYNQVIHEWNLLIFRLYYLPWAIITLLMLQVSNCCFIALALRKFSAKPFLWSIPLTLVDYLVFELTWALARSLTLPNTNGITSNGIYLVLGLSVVNCLVFARLKAPRKPLAVSFLFAIDLPFFLVPIFLGCLSDAFYYDGTKWQWLESSQRWLPWLP